MKFKIKNYLKKVILAGAFFTFSITLGASASILTIPSADENVPVYNEGNVLKDYSSKDIYAVDNTTPMGNMDRKYNARVLDPNGYNTPETFNAIAGSNTNTSLSTLFYLPEGFNETNFQHGNFQSVTLDNEGNIYITESNGSDTDLGVIAKFNIDQLRKIGVGQNPNLILNAFSYFNPYTPEGIQHNLQYDKLFNQSKSQFKEISSLKTKLGKQKSAKNNYENKVRGHSVKNKKSTLKKFDKEIKSTSAKLSKAIKSISKAKGANADLLKNVQICETAQLSPQVDIGHGQTLSFNPQNKHLYIVQDNILTDLQSMEDNNQVLEIDPNTMQPIRKYEFKMWRGSSSNLQLHTLAFDNDGNAYWGRKNGMGYMFFYGRLDQHDVQFQAAPAYFKNRGGSPNQDVAMNNATGRLYYITDDILTSIPVTEVRDGSFTASDIHYQVYDSKREFEDMTFDNQGYGYLLSLWPAQIMKSSAPME